MSLGYFVRHALSDNPKRLVGYDSPIGSVGKLQLIEVANFFQDKDMEKILHSPLIRAKETAVAIAGTQTQLLEADERLRERKWGKDDATWQEFWEILDQMTLMERYKYQPPGGESWQEFEQRTAEFWSEKMKNINGDVVIVSHEGTMRCILAYLLRDKLGGLQKSLEWSIQQLFAFGSVSTLDPSTMEFKKEVFAPKQTSLV